MRALAALALLLAACSSDEHALIIEVRSDLTPGIEFVLVEARLDSPVRRSAIGAVVGEEFASGVRVVDWGGLPTGDYAVELEARDASGEVVVGRRVLVDLRESLALTVVLARSCNTVVCPGSGDPPELSTCASGRCVVPTCSEVSPESCGAPTCTTGAECPSSIGCVAPMCLEGGCFSAPDDARCAADEVCSPAVGCVPRDVGDAGRDGATDASIDALDAGAVITRGQTANPPFSSDAPVTVDVDFTPGRVFVAVPYWNDPANTVTITDSAGHSWMTTPRQTVPSGCAVGLGTNIQIAYATITASGAATITATQAPGTGFFAVFTVEYDGIDLADPVDGEAGSAATMASNDMSTGAFTTSSAGVIVGGFHDSLGGGRMIPGPDLDTLAVDTMSYGIFLERLSTAGSQEVTARLPMGTSDACWVGTAIALRAR